MADYIEVAKFELLRAKWESQQQGIPNTNPTTPGRTPAQQRRFYSSSSEIRESKVRRFSSFAAFTSPINLFARRDRSAMPVPKSPSYKALVTPDNRKEPPPPLGRHPGSRLPSFKSASNAMPPPPLPAGKGNRQAPDRRSLGRLPRSNTTSNISLLTSSAPENMRPSSVKPPPSGIPSRKTTGLKQPSQSTSNLIRSRPPTPHRSADEPMPVTAHSTNNLIALTSSASSMSFNNLRNKLPTPTGNRELRQSGVATKMFSGMMKTPRAKDQRSYTQPNLTSAMIMPSQLGTPRQTVFREEFATKTPRYMTRENCKPLPVEDDLFGPEDGLYTTEEPESEEFRRYGAVGGKDWGGIRAIETPTTVKPNKKSGVAPGKRGTQLPRLHSAGVLPTQGSLLTPLSPPFPRTPRHSTAHSQSLLSPGSGTNPPTILRHSHLSPCMEDSHSNPKTAIRLVSTGQLRSRSPPASQTPTSLSISTTSSSPASPTPGSNSATKDRPPPPHALVTTAQAPSYWAGRFASCSDRLRLAAFEAEGHAFRRTGRVSDTFGAFDVGSDESRARQAFADLAACCRSTAAARSLTEFQRQWATRCGSIACMPSPTAVIVLGAVKETGAGADGGGGGKDGGDNVVVSGSEEGLRGGEGKGRKAGTGFMERLRVITRKTSA